MKPHRIYVRVTFSPELREALRAYREWRGPELLLALLEPPERLKDAVQIVKVPLKAVEPISGDCDCGLPAAASDLRSRN